MIHKAQRAVMHTQFEEAAAKDNESCGKYISCLAIKHAGATVP